MTIDPARLRHLVYLASGEQASAADIARLAVILETPEEIFPHLLLRKGGFKDCRPMQDALRACLARGTAQALTPRPPTRMEARQLGAARDELRAAFKAMIERDLANADLSLRLDDARRALTIQLPAAESEPRLRIKADR